MVFQYFKKTLTPSFKLDVHFLSTEELIVCARNQDLVDFPGLSLPVNENGYAPENNQYFQL